MTFSIRRFLVASILMVILGGGLLLGILTYRTIYHELDEQYDAELVTHRRPPFLRWIVRNPAICAILSTSYGRAANWFLPVKALPNLPWLRSMSGPITRKSKAGTPIRYPFRIIAG